MIRPTLFALALVATAPLVAQPTAIKNIARAQVVANSEAEFVRVDANKDGMMTRAEIEGFLRTRAIEYGKTRNKEVFAALDADKNGQLSAVEFAKLNSGEPKVDATSVLRIDTNKDGKVSLAEHRAATLDTFTKLDANKDGMLTAEEVRDGTSLTAKK
jgi:Ca2+-binding EF-hand superfamily protein